MVGEAHVGKTSMMVKYVGGKFDTDYCETMGVNCMDKKIKLRQVPLIFSIWDIGGSSEFRNMLPMVCNEAHAILFMFDLTRRKTLMSIKEWHHQVRRINKGAFAFLVGSKYDLFAKQSAKDRADTIKMARRYAHAMKAPLIMISTPSGHNVDAIFKLIISKAFRLKLRLQPQQDVSKPLLEGF